MKAGQERQQTAFRLPKDTVEKLDALARNDYRNRTQMIVALIEKAAKEREVKA